MHIADRFKGCIIGGAIGDAWGSAWEFDNQKDDQTTWYWGKKPEPDRSWMLTDDTQLTLATCEILGMHRKIEPAVLAAHFLLYYKQGKLSGVGASTLKAQIRYLFIYIKSSKPCPNMNGCKVLLNLFEFRNFAPWQTGKHSKTFTSINLTGCLIT